MSQFFVVCIGRSGSTWLSTLLGCPHESGDTRSKVIPQPWTPFPLERWGDNPDYGEVNGMLRYHLSSQHVGQEVQIKKRVYLSRDPLDIIRSWMYSSTLYKSMRQEDDLSATAQEVLWHANNLSGWAKSSKSLEIRVEDLWGSVDKTQLLVDYLLGEGFLEVTDDMMKPKNQNPSHHNLRWEWTPERLQVVQRAANRVGYTQKSFI